jgi:hypothetical protein
MPGPAKGCRKRAKALRSLLQRLALIAFDGTLAQAQMLTSELLRPVRDGFVPPQDSPPRRTSDQTGETGPRISPATTDSATKTPSRIGKIPT